MVDLESSMVHHHTREMEESHQRKGQTRLHLNHSLWRNDTYTVEGHV